jgi:hypothetical protein
MRRKRPSRVPISLFSFQDIITSVTAILLLLTLLLAFELIQRTAIARSTQPQQVAEKVTESLEDLEAELRQLESQLANQGDAAMELAKYNRQQIQQQVDSVDAEIARLQSEIRQLNALKQKFAEEESVRRLEQRAREKDRKRLADIREQQRRTQQEIEELQNSNRRFFRVPPVSGKVPWLVEIARSHIRVGQVGTQQTTQQFKASMLTSACSSFLQWTKTVSPHSTYFVLAIRPSGARAYSDVLTGLRAQGFDVGFEIIGENDALLDELPARDS